MNTKQTARTDAALNSSYRYESEALVRNPLAELARRLERENAELAAALLDGLNVLIDGEWGTPAHAEFERKARAALARVQS